MYEGQAPAALDESAEIARHEVSEDGVHWRPYDHARDRLATLHTRMTFADPANDAGVN